MDAIESRIADLCGESHLPIEIPEIHQIASGLNQREVSSRLPWVRRLQDIDKSLGIYGFIVEYDEKEFSFYHSLAFDHVYRPIKYVYMDVCYTFLPAPFSRNLAENACAHVEQGLRVFLNATKTGIAKPKATLGKLLSLNSDKIGYDLFHKIDTLNKLVYGRTKHDFKIAAPREQLLSLVESLVIYFVSRRIAVELLTECGVANQIADDLRKAENGQDGVFIGQTWSI